MSDQSNEIGAFKTLAEVNKSRSMGDIDRAIDLLLQASKALEQLTSDERFRLWSLYYYESANVNQILGNYHLSVAENRRSSGIALEGGDPIRGWVGSFTANLASYVGDLISAEQYLEKLRAAAGEFDRLGEPNVSDIGIFNSFRFSLRLATANVLFDLNDQQFLPEAEEVFVDEHFQSRIVRNVTAFKLIDLQLRARIHMMSGNLDKAIDTFKIYVDFPSRDLPNDQRFIDYAKKWPIEFARDFRDCGQALTGLGGHQHAMRAVDVWRAGLDRSFGQEGPSYDWANRRYRREIEELLIKFEPRLDQFEL
ncbi:MAG: hypothetical protein AAGA63_08585 [Pseudomonadota bacterium]